MSVEPGNRGIVQRFGGETGYFVKGRVPQIGDSCILYPVNGSDAPVCIPFTNFDLGDFVFLMPDFNFNMGQFDFSIQATGMSTASLPVAIPGFHQAVTYLGEIVYVGQFSFYWDGGGNIYISRSSTSLSNMSADDALIASTVHGSLEFKMSYQAVYTGTPNITSICRGGDNHVDIYVKDIYGTYISLTDSFIISV